MFQNQQDGSFFVRFYALTLTFTYIETYLNEISVKISGKEFHVLLKHAIVLAMRSQR
jgi:hypothetical protein